MTTSSEDDLLSLFDDVITLALAQSTERLDAAPRPAVKQQLIARLREASLPPGFAVARLAGDDDWRRHPVPGIKMRLLSLNRTTGEATLLLDVAPGTRFPPHHHAAAEGCYVLAGSLYTCGRRLGPGDFVHADANTDHAELWTEDGCQVLLIGAADEHLGG